MFSTLRPFWIQYKEWKKLGGGESTWNCGSSNTRGVGILLRKHFSFKLTETFRDQNSSH
jgi:hypothetical protein